MFAEQDKRRDIPAHDKHTDRRAYNGIADGIDISQVFRGEEKGIGAKGFHECAIHRTEKNKPEQQENLVLPEMKEQQLNRKRMIEPFEPGFHEQVNSSL